MAFTFVKYRPQVDLETQLVLLRFLLELVKVIRYWEQHGSACPLPDNPYPRLRRRVARLLSRLGLD